MADFFQNKINQYLGDISRSAKFHIVIEPPTGLSLEISKPNELNAKNNLTGAEFNNAIQYFCTAGSFPGLTGETIEFKYRGRTIPIPGVSNPNQTWTATFYNDEAHGIRKFFKDWIERTQMWSYKSDDINTERTQDSFIGSYIAVYQWDFELKNKTVIYYLYQPFPVTDRKSVV